GGESLGQRTHEITTAEFLKIEVIGRGRSPEAERVNGFAAVAYDGAIEWDTEQSGRLACYDAQTPALQLEGAVQPDFHFLVRSRHLPRILTPQPVVWPFLLPAIPDGLLENAVLVSKTVAHGRKLHRGRGFDETSRQAAEAAIAQPRVRFLLQHINPFEALMLNSGLYQRIEQKVGDIVGQGPANEELQ